MKAKLRHSSGLTLIEAMIVVAVLAVLVATLLPTMGRRRPHRHEANCRNNLKQIALSFRQWALDYGDKYPTSVSITNAGAMEPAQRGIVWPVFQVLSNELNTPKVLICPLDAKRTNALAFSGNLSNWEISYFVGLDADVNQPAAPLAGDSDLQVNGTRLPTGLAELSTNRIVQWSNKRHKHQGLVGLASGSVQSYSDKALTEMLRATGLVTNRLAVP